MLKALFIAAVALVVTLFATANFVNAQTTTPSPTTTPRVTTTPNAPSTGFGK